MQLLYTFSIYCYQGFIRVASLFHSKARQMVQGQKRTIPLIKHKLDLNKETFWFHAASLGEFEQGRPLIETIKKQSPDSQIVLSFFSPSGYEIRKNYKEADVVCYLPFDTKKNAAAFINAVNPSKVIFIKYEFWANYLTILHQKNIPTFLISAIFRPDQLFFRKYGLFYRRLLTFFDHIFVQDQRSASILSSHHIQHVSVAGDTRFDRVIAIASEAKQLPLIEKFCEHHQVYIMGSSWPADETLMISYFNTHPSFRLIIAPHVTNAAHIKAVCDAVQRPCIRLSEATIDNVIDAECLVIDSIGLLSSIYRYGDAAYIGGGFGAGIHNVLEAAVYGIPVIFGPKFQKFREAIDLIQVGGGFSVQSQKELDQLLNEWAQDNQKIKKAGHEAEKYVRDQQGATQKILPYLLTR
ncbi:MAG: 3-deoxy-D-manno-octulosonic acid transferase [Microbacter sp.]